MGLRYTDSELHRLAAFYDQHGAVHLPGLIEPAWVERVLVEIDRAAGEFRPTGASSLAASYGAAPGRMTIRSQSDFNPVIREFLFRHELTEIIARIAGTRVLQFWFDLTFIHEAQRDGTRGEGTRWHHDISAFAFKGEKLPSLWMAMTPARKGQSRLEFIDGSHRSVPAYLRPPTGELDDCEGMLDVPDYDALVRSGAERVLAWDCEPGDAIVIHPYAVHGAEGNTGDARQGRRVAITTRWFGDDVRWLPIDSRVAGYAAGLNGQFPAVGSRPSRATFPVVWPA
jgi:ectoine hydroxylase-related dioxygenase (phytanoyl-CoA dioxygenase family)